MRILFSLISVLGILFLASCSDNNQDFSPVSPDTAKLNFGPGPAHQFIYDYMQEFSDFQVESYDNSKSSSIVIRLQDTKAPDEIVQAFALLDYSSPLTAGECNLIYIGKPNSTTIEIPGENASHLTDVKVFALTNSNGKMVTSSYDQFQHFQEMLISHYGIDNNKIKISTPSWNNNLVVAFLEITTKAGSKLYYLQKPASQDFSVPLNVEGQILGVKLFGQFD